MNRTTLINKWCTRVLCVIVILFVSQLSTFANFSESLDKTIENRILSLPSSVDLRYNNEVKKRIYQYTVSHTQHSKVILGRISVYFPTFENILKEKGLPDDIKYLAAIESSLIPHATSRSGASGLWQFMRPTARMMGLTINRTIDERRDVEKSTYAAADYLLDLYRQFDDWTLAIAAYNCGPGNLRKAIRKSGGKTNYWDIQQYLPRETREYVPKFIAMSYLMNYYYAHNIVPISPEEKIIHTSKAQVFEKINLVALSKELSLDFETVKLLNPVYLKNYIPNSKDGSHLLILPTPEMRIVAEKYQIRANLPVIEVEEDIEEIVARAPINYVEKIPASILIGSNEKENAYQLSPIHTSYIRIERKKKQVSQDQPSKDTSRRDKKFTYTLGKMARD